MTAETKHTQGPWATDGSLIYADHGIQIHIASVLDESGHPYAGDAAEANARQMISVLIAIHGDKIEDAVMIDGAVEAFAAGRPAFYSTASHHSGRAVSLCNTANRTGDLVEALHQEYALGAPGREYGLNALVPLNDEAVGDLLGAYQSIGTFLDWDELEARRTRMAVEKV